MSFAGLAAFCGFFFFFFLDILVPYGVECSAIHLPRKLGGFAAAPFTTRSGNLVARYLLVSSWSDVL
jgi:hypothetical protein